MTPFFQANDDGFQYWEPPPSDNEQDTENAGSVSKISQPEARATEEDDELEIVSATGGTVRVIIYSYCNCYATTTTNITMELL